MMQTKDGTDRNRKFDDSKRREYDELKARGICVKCRKEPARPGKVRGEICSDIDADWSAGRADLRREAGLCVQCGKRPNTPGRASCAHCRAAKRAQKQKQLSAGSQQ